MRTIKIDVNHELVDYIQRLHFEVEQRKDIIQRLIEAHANDTDATVLTSSAFKAYSAELSDFVAEYELAKQELENKFVPQFLKEHQIRWNLDFANNQLSIDVLCNCEIPELNGEKSK